MASKVCKVCGESKLISEFAKFRQTCSVCYNKLENERYYNSHEHKKQQARQHYEKNKDRILAERRVKAAKKRREWKEKVLQHYGNQCACCGISEQVFLTIDHVNGGGTQHRKKVTKATGHFYKWLVDNGYPDGFQVLCWNCNWAKHYLGVCPHQGSST
jgi:hypothetical protein